MNPIINKTTLAKSIKLRLVFFIAALTLSGLTAFPIEGQLHIAHDWIVDNSTDNSLSRWIDLVYSGVSDTNSRYPFISYGTDWLGFAHLIIAIAFIGPLRDPVRNIWVIEFGIIACVLILPFALVAGAFRGIPVYWRLIDCCFGLFGGLLLWSCLCKIRTLQEMETQ